MAILVRSLEKFLYLRANAGIIPVIAETPKPREIAAQFSILEEMLVDRVAGIVGVGQMVNQLIKTRLMRVTDFIPTRIITKLNMVSLPLTSDLLEDLRMRRDVVKIYPDKLVQTLEHPIVPPEGVYTYMEKSRERQFTSTYWTSKILGAHEAWNKGVNGTGVKIAVIDTTAFPVHESISGAVWDTVYPGIFTDQNGHGVWVAAAAAGKPMTIQNIQTGGVAPNAQLITIKALGFIMGFGTSSAIVDAISRAVFTHHAKIVNMSLGSSEAPEKPEDDAEVRVVESLSKQGVVFCVAAGNDGDVATINSPGIAESAITVGSYNPITGELSPFSSQGPTKDGRIKPDVTAPGQDIIGPTVGLLDFSTHPKPFLRAGGLSGTSMSTPAVAGMTALFVQSGASYGLNVDANMIKEMMKTYGEYPYELKNNQFGWGVPTWSKWKKYMAEKIG
ncbi:MAG: S8 family serine peptidase [Thermoproteota archaeon]